MLHLIIGACIHQKMIFYRVHREEGRLVHAVRYLASFCKSENTAECILHFFAYPNHSIVFNLLYVKNQFQNTSK